ncbi:MAG TPA: hypothetical protein VFT99_13225 [Roseiflexaceae bacterium]|nr:hypothetical protein [Roseiflexaceae bacterium]
MSERVRFADRGQTAQEWMQLFPKMRDAGDGILNLHALSAVDFGA